MDSIRQANATKIGSMTEFEGWMSQLRIRSASSRTSAIIYRIPVIVHVVHNGESVGQGPNISSAQVQSQIDVLNEDFGRITGTNGFNEHPDGADTQIEFFLALTDPDGNTLAEPGIDRLNGGREEWPKGVLQNPIENSLKPATIWDPERYFNIWTLNFGGFLGRNLLG